MTPLRISQKPISANTYLCKQYGSHSRNFSLIPVNFAGHRGPAQGMDNPYEHGQTHHNPKSYNLDPMVYSCDALTASS